MITIIKFAASRIDNTLRQLTKKLDFCECNAKIVPSSDKRISMVILTF